MRSKPLSQDPKRSWGVVESIEDLLEIIAKNSPTAESFLAYRGQANSKWLNQPSLMRTPPAVQSEHKLVREIIGLHPEEFVSDRTMFDRLVRMQHFGLPTRLSDVTANPLEALYFACEPHTNLVQWLSRKDKIPENVFQRVPSDGKILISRVRKDHAKYYDSHTVSIIANLARLDWRSKLSLSGNSDTEASKKALNNLFRLINEENSAFRDEIDPNDVFKKIYVTPKHGNKRIVAQSGAFIICGLRDPENKIKGSLSISHVTIPHGKKVAILAKLDDLGINGRTMFPELDKAAKYLAEKYGRG